MQEVIFRGKRIDNGECVWGSLIHRPDTNKYHIWVHGRDKSWAIYEVAPGTVGQYIGIKVKDNHKIYEGDIIEHDDGTLMIIKPIIPIDRFYDSYETPTEDDWMSTSDVDWRIVGTVWSDPGLVVKALKQDKERNR